MVTQNKSLTKTSYTCMIFVDYIIIQRDLIRCTLCEHHALSLHKSTNRLSYPLNLNVFNSRSILMCIDSFAAEETTPMIKDRFNVEDEIKFILKDDIGIPEKLNMELLAKTSEIDVLKSDCMLKNKEIQRLKSYQTDLEIQLSDLKTLKSQLMGGLKAMHTESTIITECMDKVLCSFHL